MRRFEFVEGRSSKFWQVELKARKLHIQWGRIGTDGQSQSKTFASKDLAAEELGKLVHKKTKEGYVEVVRRGRAASAPSSNVFLTKGMKLLFQMADFDARDPVLFALRESGDALEVEMTTCDGSSKLTFTSHALRNARSFLTVSQGAASAHDGEALDAPMRKNLPPFLLGRAAFAELKHGATKLVGSDGDETLELLATRTRPSRVNGKAVDLQVVEAKTSDGGLVVLDDARWPLVLHRMWSGGCFAELRGAGTKLKLPNGDEAADTFSAKHDNKTKKAHPLIAALAGDVRDASWKLTDAVADGSMAALLEASPDVEQNIWAALDGKSTEVADAIASDVLALVPGAVARLIKTFDIKGGHGHAARLSGLENLAPDKALPLAERAARDGSDAVKSVAISVLLRAESPHVGPIALELLRGKTSGDLRASALHGIAELEAPTDEAVLLVIAALGDAKVSSLASTALMRFDQRRDFTALALDAIAKETLPDAAPQHSDKKATERYNTVRNRIQALLRGVRPTHSAAKAVLERFKTHADPLLRREAITQLTRRGDAPTVELAVASFAKLARDEQAGIVQGLLKRPDGVAILVDHTKRGTFSDPNALRALLDQTSTLKDERFVDALLPLLSTADRGSEDQLFATLSRFPTPKVARALLRSTVGKPFEAVQRPLRDFDFAVLEPVLRELVAEKAALDWTRVGYWFESAAEQRKDELLTWLKASFPDDEDLRDVTF